MSVHLAHQLHHELDGDCEEGMDEEMLWGQQKSRRCRDSRVRVRLPHRPHNHLGCHCIIKQEWHGAAGGAL